MHTDMISRKKTIRIWTIISVCSLGLYITSCDSGELPGKEKDPANIELRFAVSISGNPFTKAAVFQPGIITEGTAFPNGTHTFGMFISAEGGVSLPTGSDDNMKSILTRTGLSDVWSHTDKNDNPLSLQVKPGDRINITGYYPWESGASATSVHFDLSGDVTTWKDLLYLSPIVSQEVLDATPIALKFSHAYCWVTVKLSKLTDKAGTEVPVKAVTIEGSYSTGKGIMNQGYINPKTGEVISGTIGPLVINCNSITDLPLAGSSFSEFHFLVPPFMSRDVKNSDIMIRVTTVVKGATRVLSFPLARTHLNTANTDQYGFQKGKHNTYDIVYNNTQMTLSLVDWQESSSGEPSLGAGATGSPRKLTFYPDFLGDTTLLKMLPLTDHVNHTYLGEVAENNNGEYRDYTFPGGSDMFDIWKPIMQVEPFSRELSVASGLAAGGAEVVWKDEETGVLTAKQACLEFREGKYTDWRLPRISELYILYYPKETSSSMLLGKEYWSATEADATHSYAIVKMTSRDYKPEKQEKTRAFYVRCVRDFNKPRP